MSSNMLAFHRTEDEGDMTMNSSIHEYAYYSNLELPQTHPQLTYTASNRLSDQQHGRQSLDCFQKFTLWSILVAWCQKCYVRHYHPPMGTCKHWTGILEYWTGVLEYWTGVLGYWTGILDWNTGILDWNTGILGLEYWTGLILHSISVSCRGFSLSDTSLIPRLSPRTRTTNSKEGESLVPFRT